MLSLRSLLIPSMIWLATSPISVAAQNPTPQTPETACEKAALWLAKQQEADGSWVEKQQQKRGDLHQVGQTALALMALESCGNRAAAGPYSETVNRGISWLLRSQQSNGLFGGEVGNPTLYNHGLATLALVRLYQADGKPVTLKPILQDALEVLVRARNPYAGWRYSLEPNGDNDASSTGFLLAVILNAHRAGLELDSSSLEGPWYWLESCIDKETGLTVYSPNGPKNMKSSASRERLLLERFPTEYSEALTSLALLNKWQLDRQAILPMKQPWQAVLAKQSQRLHQLLPVWQPQQGRVDLYFWYWASEALQAYGGDAWQSWRRALQAALLPNQRRDGDLAGSWDPVGPWQNSGGNRLYATSLAIMALRNSVSQN
ncbi:MAG: hypothetical protein DWQ01_16710 [Planctomycetota bacterium]|nr:MAG: hypothetical protein DWQ01_16710 [Planctomycetota bacterium]